MKLIHYSSEPLKIVTDVEKQRRWRSKPQGLWLSVDDSWLQWYKENWRKVPGGDAKKYKYATQIILHEDANIKWIKNSFHLRFFGKKYRDWSSTNAGPFQATVDWERVSKDFDGIIIPQRLSPIVRRDFGWYFDWQDPVGCIWRSRVIKELKPLPVVE